MAETIRGINVVIGADTTALAAALSDVNKKSRDIQTELKQVEKLLKLDPTNTELLAQKQKLLGDAIESSREKLNRLKMAQQQVNEQFAKGDISEGQYRAFQREVAKTEQELRGLENRLSSTDNELKQQSKSVSRLGKDYQESFDQASKSLGNTFDRIKMAGAAITAAGVAMGAGLGAAVKQTMEFDAAMSKVKGLANATADEFAALRKQAIDLGASTSFSASQVAEGMQELAAAGFNASQIMAAMPGVLSATAASGEEMSLVAETMASTLNGFGLQAAEAGRVADILAQAANSSAISVQDMAYSLKFVGPPAKALGVSLEEVGAALIEMGNAGIKSEQAGTTLRAALLRLVDPPKEAKDVLNALGVSIVDTSGKMLPFSDIIDQLNKKLAGQTEAQKAAALATIFGLETVSGMMVLVDQGKTKFDAYTKSLQNSAGASKNAADIMKDNLKGSVDQLTGAVESAAISIGSKLSPAVRKTADALTDIVNKFNGMSDGMQTAVVVGASLTAGLTLLTGPLLLLIGYIPQIVAGLRLIGPAITASTGPIGLVVAAIATLISTFMAVNSLINSSIHNTNRFKAASADALQSSTGSFQKFRSELAGTAKSAESSGKAVGAGLVKGITDGIKEGKQQSVDALKETVDAMKKSVESNKETLNQIGAAIVTALKKRYDEAEQAQSEALDEQLSNEKRTSEETIKLHEKEYESRVKSLDKQVESERKASDARLKLIDKEYNEKLKLIDSEAYEQTKAIQEQIDGIDAQTKAEDKARKESEYQSRITELRKQLDAAATAEEKARLQDDINEEIANREREQLLESRQQQKDALKAQIDAIKEAAAQRKEQLKTETDDRKETEKDKLEAVKESLADQKDETKKAYEALKETEKERLKAVEGRLKDEKEAVKKHYDTLKQEENIQAEARKLVLDQKNEEIVQLLDTYNPKWQEAGKNFSDSLKKGLEGLSTTSDAVKTALDIAPDIANQVVQLEALEAKLKDVEKAAKGDGAGGGMGGGLIAGLDGANLSADQLAQTLETQLKPAIENTAGAAETTKDKAVEAFIGLKDRSIVQLNELYWSGKTVTDNTAADIADTFFGMGNTILANLKESHGKQITELSRFFADSSVLTDEEEAKALAKAQENNTKSEEEVRASQTRVAEILLNALTEKRGITQQEYDEINKIRETMNKQAEKALGDSIREQKVLLEKLKADSAEVTAQQAAEVVKNSNEQKEKTVKAAEEQYTSVMDAVIRQRDESKSITAEQADALIADAKRQRDESVTAAEDMHKRVVEQAKLQATEYVNYVNWQTGEVKGKWDTFFLDQQKSWDNYVDHIKNIDWKKTGSDVLTFFLEGFTSKESEIGKRIRSFGQGIADQLKGILGINSPSKVTMQIGEWTGEGLAIGMKNSLHDVERQAGMLADAATPYLASPGSGMSGFGSTGGSVVNQVNMEGLFAGANITIRSDDDIRKLAQEINDLSLSENRYSGGMQT
ncbi:phage tail tape measure protein, TP901 family, core region [Paenibacillus sp. UNCCL117]|uniref:phage tail tape measure protein n=1 Tax=unclassified Paenibacillus TaxID=185978 RepID=UPI00087E414D|nr:MULTISPECIES: phage tail tape measure protein [unclassified Paenibacillus]SDC70082.1 phage tail tape measure protein, TP901 family, core region [Paenibacillus sp. cl123]SFW24108.1 phage tail tape measure protein, TP901 family, core region [Paenibacillus sp. UNCCL117]